MRIYIKDENRNISFALPTNLVLNGLTSFIISRVLRRKCPNISLSARDVRQLISAVKEYKRTHKDWEIVNIDDASGDKILIKL